MTSNYHKNKFAHQLHYLPTTQELARLYELAASAFCDLTDGIDQGLDSLRQLTDIKQFEQWDMSELFVQICYDLHEQYQEVGGDVEEF